MSRYFIMQDSEAHSKIYFIQNTFFPDSKKNIYDTNKGTRPYSLKIKLNSQNFFYKNKITLYMTCSINTNITSDLF
jgi:hypothetical protein